MIWCTCAPFPCDPLWSINRKFIAVLNRARTLLERLASLFYPDTKSQLLRAFNCAWPLSFTLTQNPSYCTYLAVTLTVVLSHSPSLSCFHIHPSFIHIHPHCRASLPHLTVTLTVVLHCHPHCRASRYGAEQGKGPLRERLASHFYPNGLREADEIFVSDGSKCDIARLQMMFGSKPTVAVQV